MTNVQGSCDIGRRDRNDERTSRPVFTILCELRLEEALLGPPGVPTRLDNGGDVRPVVR